MIDHRFRNYSLEPSDPYPSLVPFDPYPSLSSEQKNRASYYERIASSFFKKYALLCKDIFRSSCIQPNKNVKLIYQDENRSDTLIAEWGPGQILLMVQNGLEEDFNELIAAGKVPILARVLPRPESSLNTIYSTTRNTILSPSQIAATLALQAVAMVLPATREADSETILEAREKLKNHLPPFWSSMLKLSVELKERLKPNATIEECQQECNYAVTTILRPALIDLVDKLEKERKQWFYKILSPLARGLSVLVGSPPVTSAQLISASLRLGADVAIDVSDQIRKVEAMKSEAGLAYLLELHKRIR